jgi:hypothetical protein
MVMESDDARGKRPRWLLDALAESRRQFAERQTMNYRRHMLAKARRRGKRMPGVQRRRRGTIGDFI